MAEMLCSLSSCTSAPCCLKCKELTHQYVSIRRLQSGECVTGIALLRPFLLSRHTTGPASPSALSPSIICAEGKTSALNPALDTCKQILALPCMHPLSPFAFLVRFSTQRYFNGHSRCILPHTPCGSFLIFGPHRPL